jgi:hypothetical protein
MQIYSTLLADGLKHTVVIHNGPQAKFLHKFY